MALYMTFPGIGSDKNLCFVHLQNAQKSSYMPIEKINYQFFKNHYRIEWFYF